MGMKTKFMAFGTFQKVFVCFLHCAVAWFLRAVFQVLVPTEPAHIKSIDEANRDFFGHVRQSFLGQEEFFFKPAAKSLEPSALEMLIGEEETQVTESEAETTDSAETTEPDVEKENTQTRRLLQG